MPGLFWSCRVAQRDATRRVPRSLLLLSSSPVVRLALECRHVFSDFRNWNGPGWKLASGNVQRLRRTIFLSRFFPRTRDAWLCFVHGYLIFSIE